MLGRLLAGVAHEFNAPIGSMLSNLDIGVRLLDRLEKALANGPVADAQALLPAFRERARVDRIAGERIGQLARSLKIAARVPDPKLCQADVRQILESDV